VLLNSDLDVQQTEASLLNKSSCLAQAFGVTKSTNIEDLILVARSCPPVVTLKCLIQLNLWFIKNISHTYGGKHSVTEFVIVSDMNWVILILPVHF
jgi:hypothetical protein